MTNYEITSIIINLIGLISLFLIWWQIKSTQKQTHADHERSRRQMTIDLMMKWTETLSPKIGGARKIVESLDDENCTKIYNIESAKVPESQKTLLEGILEKEIAAANGYFEITDYEASVIRGLVLTYLNALETVLTGWRLGISDKQIIEEEFSYLYEKEKQKGVLHNFRSVAGVHSYPSIAAFCECLEKQNSKGVKVMGNVT